MSKQIAVEVINFGDELLLGLRGNSHLTYLGEQLSKYGLSILRSRVITDDVGEIQRAFRDAWEYSDLVITTGGLGPTADDLTRESIAEALGAELEFDSGIKATIETRFALMGRPMGRHHEKQCWRFKEGGVLHNECGTAPGMVYRAGGKLLIMLPGPPNELRPMFEKEVLPLLQREGILKQEACFVQLRTCGAGESTIEKRLEGVVARHPTLSVAYCIDHGIVDVRLSSRDGSMDLAELERIGQEARQLLGGDFFCFGESSLAKVVYHELRALDRRLAVAESCTGGALGDAFTNVPGASKVFAGGVICYTNDVKVALLDVPECIIAQHGAVSPECAIAMATGAAEHLSADYGLSVTGFIGPGGGNEANPLGTIHFGYHSPVGVWCKTVHYAGGRLDLKARAVNTALDWMRRKLRKYKMEEFLVG